MKPKAYSVAISESAQRIAFEHLIRPDGQEDLCFALWYPSDGQRRSTALIHRIVLPGSGERSVHGNASFNPRFLERVISEAIQAGAGIAFMHSHLSPGWQGMSPDDVRAEESICAAVFSAAGLPLVGLTMGTDGAWSARFWIKTGRKKYHRFWCGQARVVGKALSVTYMDKLLPPPRFKKELTRTVSAWGNTAQAKLARLRFGIVGVGSVGSIVAESLARMGIQHIKMIDFDRIEFLNLDRILHATHKDALLRRRKVATLKSALKKSATADRPQIDAIARSLADKKAFREVLDCDVLFSCVDRPLARSILNFIAYAHLIPVIDGGIRVERNKFGELAKADWKAHIASPERRCLECLKQYDPGHVSMDREGFLDKPNYIQELPEDHVLRRNQNVFAFSLSLASMEVLQMLLMVISPLGVSEMGEQMFHLVPGCFEEPVRDGKCNPNCLYPGLMAKGDRSGLQVVS